MKKIILPIIAGIIMLTACQNIEPIKVNEDKSAINKPEQTVHSKKSGPFSYPNLLADKDQSYALLTIGEQEDQTPIEDDQKIIKVVTNILSLPSLEMVQKVYPELQLESKTAYILFDKSGVVYQSKTIKELKSFLDKNPPK
jgi:hypothetical protein